MSSRSLEGMLVSGSEDLSRHGDGSSQSGAPVISRSELGLSSSVAELHHRVKNNFQILASLLDLQAWSTALPDLHHMLQTVRGRLQAVALTHDTRFHPTADTFALDAYLRSLVTDLHTEYRAVVPALDLRLSLAKITVALRSAALLGLIVNEVVSNVFQHAFHVPSPPKTSCLDIKLSGQDSDWALQIADNGSGGTLHREGGLGVTIIQDLTRQLDGEYECATEGGVTWRFRFGCTPLPTLFSDTVLA